jgi:biopolymer transport protein ExbB/TolQ
VQSNQRPLDSSRPRPRELDLKLTAGAGLVLTAAVYLVMYFFRDTRIGELFIYRGWIPPVVTYLTAWSTVVLTLKYQRLSLERGALEIDLLPTSLAARIAPDDAPAFVAHLDALEIAPGNPVVERLRRALLHFAARRDAREVSRQLSNHAQADADWVDSSYTLVRVFIWAVPILGFIGTVMGIGSAVGGFSESVGGAADIAVMKESIGQVTSGLGIAFDTTLLALVMSIFIMFPSSSLQKSEEDFLAIIEDYCDERLLQRLVDDHAEERSDSRIIEEAIAREMASHHAELRSWQERLTQIGETLTAQVVTGWEKIDEQLRIRQQNQIETLSRWASERQREASDELSETQRSLMRDFRTSLEGMAAVSRRLQEEGAHRIDDQLAGIERLHRRLQEEQQGAASVHREQSQALSASAEQLSHTLALIRSEATEARDEGTRQLGAVGEGIREIATSARNFHQELTLLEESQVRALGEASERLGNTLERLDSRLAAIGDESEMRLRESRGQIDSLADARAEARRRDAEVRDAQVAALNTASESLSQTLVSLRDDAQNVQRRVSQVGEDIAPVLAFQVEALAAGLAEPWRRQLAHIEKLHERLETMLRETERKVSPSRTRRFFSRS